VRACWFAYVQAAHLFPSITPLFYDEHICIHTPREKESKEKKAKEVK
jgi:hypothetical protein